VQFMFEMTRSWLLTSTDFVRHRPTGKYEGWNFNNGNYLFTTDTK